MNTRKRVKNLGMTLAVLAIGAVSLFAEPSRAQIDEIINNSMNNVDTIVAVYKNDGVKCNKFIKNHENGEVFIDAIKLFMIFFISSRFVTSKNTEERIAKRQLHQRYFLLRRAPCKQAPMP